MSDAPRIRVHDARFCVYDDGDSIMMSFIEVCYAIQYKSIPRNVKVSKDGVMGHIEGRMTHVSNPKWVRDV